MKREDIIKGKENNFMEKYTHFPKGKYITVAVLREAQSECIFRTEGSGEGLNKERVSLGIENDTKDFRAIISKRKQCAVERRTGREYLRLNDLLFVSKDKKLCALNKNTPCGKCLDCMINGYAVGDGGAQKSRMIYDNAYSILPFNMVTGVKTFNALYDNGTMRDEDGKASSSINEDEYIKPGTVFMDMITFKDVTFIEFIYGISNILRSKRYGAISKIEFPLEKGRVEEYAKASFENLEKGIFGNVKDLNLEELNDLLEYIKSVYQEDGEEKAADLFKEQSKQYGE